MVDSNPPYTVLLAENDSKMRGIYRTWLADDLRWKVREAEDGAKVLETLDSEVNVLVLDRELPKISGSELVDRLPETQFDGSVLVVSGHEQDESLGKADVAGYLTKPFSKETFIESLEQQLR